MEQGRCSTPSLRRHQGPLGHPRLEGRPWPSPHLQGVKVLGTPLGHPAFVSAHLRSVSDDHRVFLHRIPAIPDLQAAWLLLSQCANPRANYLLRALPPAVTAEYAAAHDDALWECLCTLLDLDPTDPLPDLSYAQQVAQLPLRLGGLGLRSATRLAPAAHWASWADVLPMVGQRHPAVAAEITRRLSVPDQEGSPLLQQVASCADVLSAEGFTFLPSWDDILGGARPPPFDPQEPPEPGSDVTAARFIGFLQG